MSEPFRDWRLRIQDVIDAIDEIQSFTEGLDFSGFESDLKCRRAVELDLIVIGEAAGNIPDSVQENHPEIPWSLMSAMRNRLAHAYFSIEPKIVWDTVQVDLPPLLSQLKELLS